MPKGVTNYGMLVSAPGFNPTQSEDRRVVRAGVVNEEISEGHFQEEVFGAGVASAAC